MSCTENNPFPTLRSSPGGGQVTTPRLSPSVCSHFMIHHAQPSPAQRRPQRSDRAVPLQEGKPEALMGHRICPGLSSRLVAELGLDHSCWTPRLMGSLWSSGADTESAWGPARA